MEKSNRIQGCLGWVGRHTPAEVSNDVSAILSEEKIAVMIYSLFRKYLFTFFFIFPYFFHRQKQKI